MVSSKSLSATSSSSSSSVSTTAAAATITTTFSPHLSFESLCLSSPHNGNNHTSPANLFLNHHPHHNDNFRDSLSDDAESLGDDGAEEEFGLIGNDGGHSGAFMKVPASASMDPAKGRKSMAVFKGGAEPLCDLSNLGYGGCNTSVNANENTVGLFDSSTLNLPLQSSVQRVMNYGHLHRNTDDGDYIDHGDGNENHSPIQIPRNTAPNTIFNRRRRNGSSRKASLSVRESLLAEAWERKRELMLNKEESGSINLIRGSDENLMKKVCKKNSLAELGRSSSDCCGAMKGRRHEEEEEEEADRSSSMYSSRTPSPSSSSSSSSSSRRICSPMAVGSGKGRNRTRSLTDEDFEELKGCIDLGFGFDHASVPAELCETLPALQVYCAVAQNFIHDSPTQAKAMAMAKAQTSSFHPNPNNHSLPFQPPLITIAAAPSSASASSPPISSPSTPTWRISSPGDDPKDVKGRLRHWAQAVACNAKLFL